MKISGSGTETGGFSDETTSKRRRTFRRLMDEEREAARTLQGINRESDGRDGSGAATESGRAPLTQSGFDR